MKNDKKKIVVDAEKLRERSASGAPTNASIKSGGRENDELVDEKSKESFPASDPSATY